MGFSFAIPNFESSGDIMRNPNGYGTVAKLSGQRRRPYIVKKTIGWNDKGHPIYDIIGYAETREAGNIMLAEYNRDPWDVDRAKITLQQLFDLWKEKKAPKLGGIQPFFPLFSVQALFSVCEQAL